MLIVPLRGDKDGLQRHAWVTYSLVALNAAFFLMFCIGPTDRDRSDLIRGWRTTITFLRERPYLAPPPLVSHLLPSDLRHRTPQSDPSVAEWKVWKDQNTLHEMAVDLRRRYDTVSDVSMAFVPAVGAPHTIVTAMFLHAGLLHLIGNMLFLLAVAPFVEEAYGRVLFLVLYLSGGVVATLGFAYRYPNEVTPLVGASGAVAAVMGAYLFRFTLSRIQFLVIPLLFLPMWHFRFSAPALVVLPLWFLEQLVSIPAESDSGVAVTAHVAGFSYGLAVAMLLRLTFDRRVAQPKSTTTPSLPADPRLERATRALAGSDLETARREVNLVLAERPADRFALRLALDVARSRGDIAAVDQFASRLLSAYATEGDASAATSLIEELRPIDGAPPLKQFLSRAAGYAERSGNRPLAIALYERLCESDRSESVIPSLVKLATLKRSKGDVSGARDTLNHALNHPGCSPEWRRKITNTLAVLPAP